MLQILKQLRIGLLLLPFLLQGAGTVANITVVTANHGAMPVVIPTTIQQLAATGDSPIIPGEALDKMHTAYNPNDIHLKALCDWVQIPWFGVASPGDLVIWAGEWAVSPVFCIWLALLYADKRKESRGY